MIPHGLSVGIAFYVRVENRFGGINNRVHSRPVELGRGLPDIEKPLRKKSAISAYRLKKAPLRACAARMLSDVAVSIWSAMPPYRFGHDNLPTSFICF